MSLETQYSSDELRQLRDAARNLLGWEIAFHDLHIGGETAPGITERVVDSRKKMRIAVSEITFYPTQSAAWQRKIEKDRETGQTTARHPMEVYADTNNANPLVSVVLQRGARAKTDPLAVIKRVIAAIGKAPAEEMTWKKLLSHPSLGMGKGELGAFMDAMNFAAVLDETSQVQMRRIPGIAAFESQDDEPGETAHEDQEAALVLTGDAKIALARALNSLQRDL